MSRLSETQARAFGYWPVKQMANGELAGIQDYMFTAGVVIGIDPVGWRTRFCYETRAEAEQTLAAWDGNGDPPGNWIKQKPEERHGPGSRTALEEPRDG